MRAAFCKSMLVQANSADTIFLTGDLGYMALEPLREVLGERFLNCGVAEQNMVSVAAGMAKVGLRPWVYSIAPFIYARSFEQIRNDVCFHNLPVKLVGNGGGYGYGVMGPTHHAIEDLGALLSLPSLVSCIPAYASDLPDAVLWVANNNLPTYLRLGKAGSAKSISIPKFQGWRQLVHGHGPVLVVLGPLVDSYIECCLSLPDELRPNLWVVSILPIKDNPPPIDFIAQFKKSNHLIVAEEHVERGGLGWDLHIFMSTLKIEMKRFSHLFARKHQYEFYGSQEYLRRLSGLDNKSLLAIIKSV